jgi:diguanylate cyclase (GGDEF)-like protein
MAPFRDAAGRVTHLVGIDRDVTDRRRAHDLLAHQALHDALTDLPNRVLLGDRLRQALLAANREGHANRDGHKVAVMVLDLDGFKDVNDNCGHRGGDELLRLLGPRLQSVLRESDTVARVGGDEFAVVLLASGEPLMAQAVAHKLLAAVAQPFIIERQSVTVSASIGIAIYPDHATTVEALLQHADEAMYVAKRQHLGCTLYEGES